MTRDVVAALSSVGMLAVIATISARCAHPEPSVVTPSSGALQLSAVVEGPAAVRLSWTDNIPGDIIGIAPVRSATGEPGTFRNLMPGELPATAREYVDDSVAPDASYHYRPRWHHSDDTFSVSPIVSLTVPPVSSEPSVTTTPPDTIAGQTGEPGDTVVQPPDSTPPAPGEWPDNEPPGMTTLTHIRGDSKDWPGWRPFGSWDDTARVAVIVDPDSKYGHAVEKRFYIGDVSGWGAQRSGPYPGPGQTLPHREFKEVYVRIVFRYSPNWDQHSGGEKLWLANRGPGTSFYVRCHSFTSGGHLIGPRITTRHWYPILPDVITATANLGACQGAGVAYPRATRDEYHTVEVLKHANDPGIANGWLRVWIDGVEHTRFQGSGGGEEWRDVPLTNVRWIATNGSEPGWISARIECCLYWGGQNDTKTVDDWIRISEFYVSGKN